MLTVTVTVSEAFRNVSIKRYGAVTKVFRSSYKSSGTVISLPEQLEVLRSSYESVPEQLVSVPEQLLSLP